MIQVFHSTLHRKASHAQPSMHNGSKQESQSHFNCVINCDFMISPWTYFYGREKCWEITPAEGSRRMLRVANGEINSIRKESTLVAVPLNDSPLLCADRVCSACWCCSGWRDSDKKFSAGLICWNMVILFDWLWMILSNGFSPDVARPTKAAANLRRHISIMFCERAKFRSASESII